ncbi:hypothetical protein, partial [Rathayibacter sp. AY1F6]|uniref:hypothetical protein n=1 Tax=Rathayibacter sp. AY1F6 TaxID=2080560 RepID=UPI001CA584A3
PAAARVVVPLDAVAGAAQHRVGALDRLLRSGALNFAARRFVQATARNDRRSMSRLRVPVTDPDTGRAPAL